MLISHRHRFIFLKTRKTGGTSVEMALQPLAMEDPSAPVTESTPALVSEAGIVGRRLKQGPADTGDKWANHKRAGAIRKALGPEQWDAYRKITVIRDPFDRTVSQFFWRTALRPDARTNGLEKLETMSDTKLISAFRAFAAGPKPASDIEIVTIKDRLCIDDVIRYETMQADLARIARDLGPEAEAQVGTLPQTKVGRHLRRNLTVADFFDERSRDAVRERMAWVWELHPYNTDPRDAAPETSTAG